MSFYNSKEQSISFSYLRVSFPYSITGDKLLYAKWEATPQPTPSSTADANKHSITYANKYISAYTDKHNITYANKYTCRKP